MLQAIRDSFSFKLFLVPTECHSPTITIQEYCSRQVSRQCLAGLLVSWKLNQRRSDIQRGLGAKCFIKFQEWRGLRPSRRDSSGQDGKLYTGGKAGQIYPIGCDGKTSDVIANTRWKRPLS